MRKINNFKGCYTKQCNAQNMALGLATKYGLNNQVCNDNVLYLLSVEDH